MKNSQAVEGNSCSTGLARPRRVGAESLGVGFRAGHGWHHFRYPHCGFH